MQAYAFFFAGVSTTVIGLALLLLETLKQAQYLIPAAVSMTSDILLTTAITLILIPALIIFRTANAMLHIPST